MSRATKSGDAFRLEQKMMEKYDEEEALGTPQRIITWINKVLADQPGCKGHSYQEIHEHLKDGVVLCKLMNKLLQNNGEPTFKFTGKANTAFVAMENIEKFTNAAKGYGVPASALFQTADLYEGRKGPMLNVINSLNQLGFTANSKGFMPDYEAINPPKPEW